MEGPSIEPYSREWGIRFVKTLIYILAFTRVMFCGKETADALVTYISMLSLWPIPVGLFAYSLFANPRITFVLYSLLFLLTHQRDARHTGAQASVRIGKGWMAHSIARFLRAKLHFSNLADIKRRALVGERFIFAVHPHSMFGISTLVHFGLNRLMTRELFGNNIDFRVCTINLNFWIPILREYLMARGFVCADRSTFSTLIQRGISPVIVPGGAEETLYAYPGSADLVVGKRIGFAREAIVNNAPLTPVYCFGDNEAVPVFRSKAILKIQRIIQKWLTFATPLAIPYFTRVPLHMVIGHPLPLPTAQGSIEERTSVYHGQYLMALEHLFNEYVGKYGTPAERKGKGIRFIK